MSTNLKGNSRLWSFAAKEPMNLTRPYAKLILRRSAICMRQDNIRNEVFTWGNGAACTLGEGAFTRLLPPLGPAVAAGPAAAAAAGQACML